MVHPDVPPSFQQHIRHSLLSRHYIIVMVSLSEPKHTQTTKVGRGAPSALSPTLCGMIPSAVAVERLVAAAAGDGESVDSAEKQRAALERVIAALDVQPGYS